jgi:hypothetical protein
VLFGKIAEKKIEKFEAPLKPPETMNRRNIIKKGEKYTFDHLGKKIAESNRPQGL